MPNFFKPLFSPNLLASQRPGTKLVDITYDVASDATNAVSVSLVVSNGAAAVACPSLTGAVGAGVATGTGKSVVWNMGTDWNGNVAAGVLFAATADDGASSGGTVPSGMVLIPAGTNSGTDPDFGAYSLTVEAFYMDTTEVTKAQWDAVYTWAINHGYSFDHAGSGKAASHPVQTVSWYDGVKWCNARSQKEGRTPCYNLSTWSCNFAANGYRLPTITEWEYAPWVRDEPRAEREAEPRRAWSAGAGVQGA